MLGELYQPKGLARETAQAVLECDNPYAVNVAWGCRLGCKYPCYNWFRTKGRMTFPKEPAVDLIRKQLEKGLDPEPEGVFISFGTEPLLKENYTETWALIRLLRGYGIEVAILSKMGILPLTDIGIRHGVTLVSLSDEFARLYEPNASTPRERLDGLVCAAVDGEFTWVSIEPYPCPEIFKQDLTELLEKLSYVDFMIFGKWNYNPTCNTLEAKEFYKEAAVEFSNFCEEHKIRYHVKSDTGGVK